MSQKPSLLSQLQSFLSSAPESSPPAPLPDHLHQDIISYIQKYLRPASESTFNASDLNDPTLWLVLLNALTYDVRIFDFTTLDLERMHQFWREEFSDLGRRYQQVILMFLYNVIILQLEPALRRHFFFDAEEGCMLKEEWFISVYDDLFLDEQTDSSDEENDGLVLREIPDENPLKNCTDDCTIFAKLILQKLLLLDISHEEKYTKQWNDWLAHLMQEDQWRALVNVLDILEISVTLEDASMTPALQELIALSTLKLTQIILREYVATEKPLRFIQFEALFVMIQVIAHCTVSDFYEARFVRQSLHKAGLLSVMYTLLSLPTNQEKKHPDVNEEILKHTGLQVIKEQKGFSNMYYYYKSNMIRILGNMAYEDKEIATDMLKHELIPIILNHTRIDDLNPYIREWSIVAINHLCELSEEIREYIQEVRTLQIDPTTQSMLDKMGMKAELVGDKIHMKKEKKDEE